MIFNILRKESYSRGDLLLRTMFGAIYIGIPHMFLLLFLSIWSSIVGMISFWVILFTGDYPTSFFEFQVKLIRWSTRVQARFMNLAEGYPAFGLDSEDEVVNIDIPYPEDLSKGKLLLKAFFGIWYVMIPHMFVLYFRMIWTQVLGFLAFWAILFTGVYPQSWFEFNVGTLRWATRVKIYLGNMTDEYPPFSGKE